MRNFTMKADWNLRAQENAHKAIACDEAENEAVFRASGERDIGLVLDGVPEILPANHSALEIGCGTGRLLEPLSRHFGQVFGVDVSGEMIRRGRGRLGHLPQVHFIEIDGLGELPFKGQSFNFCFSYITFHHIPLKAVLRRYIREIHRVLEPAGIARLHFFGRPEGVLSFIRERSTHKDTWRGYKFTLPEIVAVIEAAGLEVVRTEYVPALQRRFFGKTPPDIMWVTARKPVGSAPGAH